MITVDLRDTKLKENLEAIKELKKFGYSDENLQKLYDEQVRRDREKGGAEKMGEWIKVSERLPDRNQGYIMICNSDYIGVCDTRVYHEWTDEMYNDYFGNGNIKFWQPLPPLPPEAE